MTRIKDKIETKYIMDAIFNMIPIDSRLFQIIDTPHFQRLRYIKQLGTTYLCFPTASHTRFSHSIGAAYLASRVFDMINEPELDLRPIDKLLVTTAALVHDIGHGPFSHGFEHSVIPGLGLEGREKWSHEVMGLKILEHLFDTEHIDFLDTSEITRLKQILTGTVPSEYRFLSQIVANGDFGFDVDRLDYLQRDSYSVGLTPGFDWTVLSSHLKVSDFTILEGDVGTSVRTLSFHEKRRPELLNFYHTRYNLFHQIYHHPTTKAVEYMIADAILESKDLIKISQALQDVEEYLKLDDSIYNWLRCNGNSKSKMIIDRIQRRNFYPLVYRNIKPPPSIYTQQESGDHYIIDYVVDHYGQGARNPLESVPFYSTQGSNGICSSTSINGSFVATCQLTRNFSTILPSQFESIEYRVYDRS